jgi:hypothetical protein
LFWVQYIQKFVRIVFLILQHFVVVKINCFYTKVIFFISANRKPLKYVKVAFVVYSAGLTKRPAFVNTKIKLFNHFSKKQKIYNQQREKI